MFSAGYKFSFSAHRVQRPAVRPSDLGTPFPGFLLEYVNEKCSVLHSRPRRGSSCSQAGNRNEQMLLREFGEKPRVNCLLHVGFSATQTSVTSHGSAESVRRRPDLSRGRRIIPSPGHRSKFRVWAELRRADDELMANEHPGRRPRRTKSIGAALDGSSRRPAK